MDVGGGGAAPLAGSAEVVILRVAAAGPGVHATHVDVVSDDATTRRRQARLVPAEPDVAGCAGKGVVPYHRSDLRTELEDLRIAAWCNHEHVVDELLVVTAIRGHDPGGVVVEEVACDQRVARP